MAHSNLSNPSSNRKSDEHIKGIHEIWVVVIDGRHVLLFEKTLTGTPHPYMPSYDYSKHRMEKDQIGVYLESALEEGKFSGLMVVGEADKLYRFRKSLPLAVSKRILTEIVRQDTKEALRDEAVFRMAYV